MDVMSMFGHFRKIDNISYQTHAKKKPVTGNFVGKLSYCSTEIGRKKKQTESRRLEG